MRTEFREVQTATMMSLSKENTEIIDIDPVETREWLDALESLAHFAGTDRAAFMIKQLQHRAMELFIPCSFSISPNETPYLNTIHLSLEPSFPGDRHIEGTLTSIMRWNAMMMVLRANCNGLDLGGHVGTYASAADLFEVGFNHFFRAADERNPGDLIYFQPHAAPGIYARAFLEGRLTEQHLEKFRQETAGGGLSSYPHPWLMPSFWQFPTGSMGLGAVMSIYQARFMRYLQHRDIADTSTRRVWAFLGDGEMDEPESRGALAFASREKLDNLIFVINCNLQRLDGPVRGNGSIIQELEILFASSGWNVIKLIWGSEWDAIFARDKTGELATVLGQILDGQYQTIRTKGGSYLREIIFSRSSYLSSLVAGMSDEQLMSLSMGGHDTHKIYAAYANALSNTGRPTVILANTVKGYGMGEAGEAKNDIHQRKKISLESLKKIRDRLALPISDESVARMAFYMPSKDTKEIQYLRSRREALGGYLPRRFNYTSPQSIPSLLDSAKFTTLAAGREMSTTSALIQLLSILLKNKNVARRIVPIVADEARTFGMTPLFRQIGIYSPVGQLYVPEDNDSLLCYREHQAGQILQEGINEAGAISSWIAAATAYANHYIPMLPFYIFYSVFGFQRIGDLIMAGADQRARGFLIGATSGRTTLNGEGLQHQDGSSQLTASTIPNCRPYDAAFAYEIAVIVDHGINRLMTQEHDEFFYLTVTNENYSQPSMPDGIADAIIKGMYVLQKSSKEHVGSRVTLLGSGAILIEVIAASELLKNDWGINVDVWSVTSFTLLSRDGMEVERDRRLNPRSCQEISHVERCLGGIAHPIVAATDYVRAYAEQIRPFISGPYLTLGTDGFGRSDTRVRLRSYFEVDRHHIATTALYGLSKAGEISSETVEYALRKYGIDQGVHSPWSTEENGSAEFFAMDDSLLPQATESF